MSFLGTMFFILTPFGFFCTENGTGLITGTIFLILGVVCKWIGEGGTESKIKIEPQDFWDFHYRSGLANGLHDRDARKTADAIARMNNCPIPSEEQKEKTAKSMGIVTDKMKQDEENRFNRIQVGKYYLMTELKEKYKMEKIEKNKRFKSKWLCIDYERSRLFFKGTFTPISEYLVEYRLGMSIAEVWNSLLPKEKKEAQDWVNEYETRLCKEIHDYIEHGIYCPTIKCS